MKVIDKSNAANMVGVKGLVAGQVYRIVGTPSDGSHTSCCYDFVYALNNVTELPGSGYKVHAVSLNNERPYFFHEHDIEFVFERVKAELHILKD